MGNTREFSSDARRNAVSLSHGTFLTLHPMACVQVYLVFVVVLYFDILAKCDLADDIHKREVADSVYQRNDHWTCRLIVE